MNDQLAALRTQISHSLAVWLWVNVIFAGLAGAFAGSGWGAPLLLSTLVAAGVSLAVWRAPAAQATRYLVTAGFIATISVILAAMRGTPEQLDVHMYYFAALAILAAYCDARVILLGAGLTAVQHLTANFLLPDLIFPQGANIWRVVLHAVILVIEGGALLWMVDSINRLFGQSAAALAAAQAASQEAEAAHRAIDVQRNAREFEQQAAAKLQAQAAEQVRFVVARLANALADLAGGDLSETLNDAFPAEYERLREDYNATIQELRKAIEQLRGNAGMVQNGAGEISHASNDLAARTERQAATQEETAAALNEVTHALGRTSEDVTRAREVARAARHITETSGSVVREAVDAMAAIDNSSRQISQIIGVINEIAFQTNLLALNAGVEAARAGDAGRGFAVVATEVRALAQRTADAAKEIKTLIVSSEQDVQSGVDRVNRTGTVLDELAARVSEIDDLVGAVSETARQQTTALGQVNHALSEMDQTTQRNAAMVEETSAAALELLGAAQKMAELSSRFKLTKAERVRVPARV